MKRHSLVTTHQDEAGVFETEIFDHLNPKRVIVCSHGRGVRRWDGEKFFLAVAEHYTDSAVLLVDQYQQDGDTIRMNPLPILINRVQSLIEEAKRLYPKTPIYVMAHSMGCGIAAFLDVNNLKGLILVTPAAGKPLQGYINRYGVDIVNGKVVLNSEGSKVDFTADFIDSIKDLSWETEYRKLVERFSPTYVFEAGTDEIIGDERFALRDVPFTKYEIVENAKHNLSGQPLKDFFTKLDKLI